jgi:FKBP-type peptidyl-prolyl cis-trans isomerase
MKKTMLLLTVMSAILVSSCKNIGFEKSKTGMEYKIFADGKGKQLKKGDFVKFNYKITYNDSLINSSYSFIPGYDEVDSAGRYHDFSEVLTKMKVGDSLVCFQFVDSLATQSQMGMPPYMKKGGKQKMTIKILDAFEGREQAIADYQNVIDNFKNSELKEIEKYIAKNNIKAEKVGDKVFVEIQSEGTGPVADSGLLVGIKYTGYNLEGKFFDSNVDSTKQVNKHGMELFYFVAKREGSVVGMLEGITKFRQGGKGRIFIPSILGYGPQGNPPIKPNESLIFDIEVVEVKPLPEQPAGPNPMMPGGNPNGGQ